ITPHYPFQTGAIFPIYYTREYDAEFCDDDGMESLGTLTIDLPGIIFLMINIYFFYFIYYYYCPLIDSHLGCNRPLTFGLKFGRMEITATARNDTNGQNYQTTFDIETED